MNDKAGLSQSRVLEDGISNTRSFDTDSISCGKDIVLGFSQMSLSSCRGGGEILFSG